MPFILLGLVISLLVIEVIVIRRRVRRIPIRVHVNGSRGKSSVTRYIVAGLRSGGKRVMGKITGIKPTILLPDEGEKIIARRGPANVREQLKLIRLSGTLSCDALVLECMSIASGLQQLETKVFQPHVTVLTNILEDHLEELGSSDIERTEAYCNSLPSNSIIVTNDSEHIWEIENAASRRNSRVILPPKWEMNDSIQSLSPITQQHVGLALTVCKTLGIDEQRALQGILREVKADEPLLYEFPVGENAVHFVNGFAVNDIQSAAMFLETWRGKLGTPDNVIVVLNTRSDRPRRSIEFARWCSTLNDLRMVILTGSQIPLTHRMLLCHGITSNRIKTWSSRETRTPQQALAPIINNKTMLVGFGNIAGDGFTLLDALKPFQVPYGNSYGH